MGSQFCEADMFVLMRLITKMMAEGSGEGDDNDDRDGRSYLQLVR